MAEETVLVVDADAASRKFFAKIFQQQGYKVLLAGLGEEGLRQTLHSRPSLVLFDPVLPDIKADEFLYKLREEAHAADTPVLALSSDSSPEYKDVCLKAGCTEYMVKSGEVAALLPEIIGRLVASQSATPKKDGKTIVFLSAKGGTGTSSWCANFAMTISENQPDANVVVVDLVLPIGSIAPIVGYEGDVNLVSVAEMSPGEANAEYLERILPEPPLWQFQLLPGATNPASANELKISHIPDIFSSLKATYDFVVIDLGRSLSRISLPIIQNADLLVLIVGTDLSTITLTKTVWDYLQEQGIGANRVYTILNRAVGLEGLTKAEAEEIIGLPIKTTMPYMGSNFALANNLNQPIIVKYPTDTSSVILKETANEMIQMVKKSNTGKVRKNDF